MSKFAFPSSRVTRIHGKHTYIEYATGAIRADVREESIGDRGYQVPQELCPCCHGCGQTPAGEPISEEQATLVSRGVIVVFEDSDPCGLEPCRHCNGAGTVDEDTDPDNFDEYRFTPER